jgi:hypothetical protein
MRSDTAEATADAQQKLLPPHAGVRGIGAARLRASSLAASAREASKSGKIHGAPMNPHPPFFANESASEVSDGAGLVTL